MLHLQNSILEMVATGEPLQATMDCLCREVEQRFPWVICSVLLVEDDVRLRALSGPSLPAEYSRAIDGTAIGPNVGSCGSAAFLADEVAVTDIASDPRWADFKTLALPLGFKACWSSPIRSARGKVLGTFAFYYRECRGPNAEEREAVATFTHLCAIAMERDQRIEEERRRSLVDILTGLGNRAAFDAALAAFSRDTPAAWGLMIIDLDKLKATNDTFGHAAGDELLRAAATRIRTAAAPDHAFRLGGDEFAVIVRLPDRLRDMEATASAILKVLGEPVSERRWQMNPRATIGGALAAAGDRDAEAVRQNADHALYHAKEVNRGGFVLHRADIGTRITRRMRAVQDLSLALAQSRIDAFYQPVVRLDTGDVVGLEALCRMITPAGEIVSAAAFHDATSDPSVASELTRRMVSIVAADLRCWLDLGIPFQHVGINVSSTDFHGGKLLSTLMQAFGAHDVPLSHVIIEVTESVYIGQPDHPAHNAIATLRAHGMRVALDDFGTGFASLTHLLTTPADVVKIDKSFVDGLVRDVRSRAIVDGLLDIAAKLGIAVVAEGVETETQRKQLLRSGCRLGQGFLFAQALDREAVTDLLKRRAQPLVKEAPATPELWGAVDVPRQPRQATARPSARGMKSA